MCSIGDIFEPLADIDSIDVLSDFVLTADSDRQDGGSCVGRDGQELCSCGCVAKRRDDRGKEKGKCIERDSSWSDAC